MKYIDINQKFTAKVAEYIAKGYTINTATMSGSLGEVAHVDLTDGKQVVRVLLDSFTEYNSSTACPVWKSLSALPQIRSFPTTPSATILSGTTDLRSSRVSASTKSAPASAAVTHSTARKQRQNRPKLSAWNATRQRARPAPTSI